MLQTRSSISRRHQKGSRVLQVRESAQIDFKFQRAPEQRGITRRHQRAPETPDQRECSDWLQAPGHQIGISRGHQRAPECSRGSRVLQARQGAQNGFKPLLCC